MQTFFQYLKRRSNIKDTEFTELDILASVLTKAMSSFRFILPRKLSGESLNKILSAVPK